MIIHLISCRLFRGARLAWAQFVILSGTSVLLLIIAGDRSHQADPKLYSHMLIVPVVLILGLPFNRWFANRLFNLVIPCANYSSGSVRMTRVRF